MCAFAAFGMLFSILLLYDRAAATKRKREAIAHGELQAAEWSDRLPARWVECDPADYSGAGSDLPPAIGLLLDDSNFRSG